ncbi:uncharacterized protein [Aristolochia californica]|uniref:uncharacterized protein isoform X2 n=1 Tax=Aristolochia californica TaxID=171875 RepID=UPI0035DB1684
MRAHVDRTALSPICITEHPTEQFSPQTKNTANANEGDPITQLRLPLGSTDLCNLNQSNIDLGAGANAIAIARVDRIINVTTNPLSELVWSPQKGLSLKCTDCGLSEKRSPFLWSTESASMTVLPTPCIIDKEADSIGPTERTLVQSTTNPGNELPENPSSAKLAHNFAGITRFSQSNQRAFENMGMSSKVSGAGTNISKEMAPSFSRDTKATIDTCLEKTDKVGMPATTIAGLSNGRGFGFLMLRQEEPNASKVKAESKCGDPLEKDRDTGSADMHMLRPLDVSQIAPFSEEENKCRASSTNSMKLQLLERLEFMSENVVQTVEVEVSDGDSDRENKKVLSLVDKVLTETPSKLKKDKKEALCEIEMKESYSVAPADKVLLEIPSKLKKDKGKAVCDTETKGSYLVALTDKLLKETSFKLKKIRGEAFCHTGIKESSSEEKNEKPESVESSNSGGEEKNEKSESVESSNSGGVVSSRKRACSIDQHCLSGSKKIKRQSSSFINWISNMTSGLPKLYHGENLSLDVAIRPTCSRDENHYSLPAPNGRNQNGEGKKTGFGNVFQALYSPTSRIEDERIAGAKKINDTRRVRSDTGSDRMDNKVRDKLHEHDIASNDISPNIPNISSTGVVIAGKNSADNFNGWNEDWKLEKGGSTSKMSCGENPVTHDCKEANSVAAADAGMYSASLSNKQTPAESLWITRFTQKFSNLGQCNANVASAVNALSYSNQCLDHSEGRNNLERHHGSPAEILASTIYKDGQDGLEGCPTSTCGSKRTILDQKFTSKLYPILPSQRFKSPVRMASIFARRLDALRHIIPSKSKDDTEHKTTICFFCGVNDHTLKDCTEILESDLEDLLKTLNFDNGEEDMLCLCIRCFQLNHWAIACPYASTRKTSGELENREVCSQDFHIKNTSSKLEGDEGNNCLHQHVTSYAYSRGKKSGLTNIAVCSSVWKPNGSFSENHKMKGSRTIPFNSRETPAVPRGLFEAIKQLHLSRTDILRGCP